MHLCLCFAHPVGIQNPRSQLQNCAGTRNPKGSHSSHLGAPVPKLLWPSHANCSTHQHTFCNIDRSQDGLAPRICGRFLIGRPFAVLSRGLLLVLGLLGLLGLPALALFSLRLRGAGAVGSAGPCSRMSCSMTVTGSETEPLAAFALMACFAKDRTKGPDEPTSCEAELELSPTDDKPFENAMSSGP